MKTLKLGQENVTAKYMSIEVTGTIYDLSDTHVWIENDEDMYQCKIEDVKEVIEVKKTTLNGLTFITDHYSDSDRDFDFDAEEWVDTFDACLEVLVEGITDYNDTCKIVELLEKKGFAIIQDGCEDNEFIVNYNDKSGDYKIWKKNINIAIGTLKRKYK